LQKGGFEMKVVCAWCRKFIREIETSPPQPNAISYGMCKACYEKNLQESLGNSAPDSTPAKNQAEK
jgi:hypothetical protein